MHSHAAMAVLFCNCRNPLYSASSNLEHRSGCALLVGSHFLGADLSFVSVFLLLVSDQYQHEDAPLPSAPGEHVAELD